MSVARQPGSRHQQPSRILVTGADTGGRLALVQTVELQGHEPPCHAHHWEDETLYVLDGDVAVFCGGTWMRAAAGTAVLVPRGSEHSFAVLSGTARVLFVFAPAGLEAWYREAGARPPWSGNLERMVATAARYGCEVTGPHPGRP